MKKIAELLVKNEAVKVNFEDRFKWTSGILSPIYCDCRELISLPEVRQTITQEFLNLIKEQGLSHDIISGTATAGIPWASFVADQLNDPMIYVRSKPKGHGAGKMVEGRAEMGKNILVVEDAISTGGSSIKSAEALRDECEATVENILAIFTWATPLATLNAEKAGVKMWPLTNFEEIVDTLFELNKITEAQKQELIEFKQGLGK